MPSPAGAIEPPPILQSPSAIRVWRWLAGDLQVMHLLQSTDHAAFARYCQHLADWCEAQADIDANGYSQDVPTTGGIGTMQRFRPAYHVKIKADQMLRDAEDRFGMSPLGRYRLQLMAAQSRPTAPTAADDLLAGTEPAADSPVGFVSGGQRTH